MRLLLMLIAALAVAAFVTRAPGPRRILATILGLLVVYAILKLTGVIDAMAPDRM